MSSDERALLVKFFYLNLFNTSATLCVLEHAKKGNGTLSHNGFRAMATKFVKISSLKDQSGRGRKPLPQDKLKKLCRRLSTQHKTIALARQLESGYAL